MARKANPAVIGAFLIGALALVVAGLVVFGGGKFFTQKKTVVAYFEGSLKGMAVGAPVTFNGVKIGSVTDVKVVINTETNAIRTPVFFTIEAGRLREVSGAGLKFKPGAPQLQPLIDRGLRAQLELQSLVTGQLEVALNFFPGTPIKLTGLTEEYPEVPTIPSTTEKLIATLENIPLDKLVAQVMHAVQSIDNLVTSPEIKKILQGLDHTLLHIDGVVGNVDGVVGNVDKTVTVGRGAIVTIDRVFNDGGKTIAAGQDAIVDVRELLARAGPALEAALRELEKLAKDGQKLAKDGQKLAVSADGMVNTDSPLRDELANTLREIQAAARSLRVLTDYLDQHPEAVISGKRAQQRQ